MAGNLKCLHHHHISMIGFKHVSQWTLQQLLLHLTKTYLENYEESDTENKAIYKVFSFLKKENVLNKVASGKLQKDILIDEKNDLKAEISLTSLDVTLVVSTLQNMKCFPTASENYRKDLICKLCKLKPTPHCGCGRNKCENLCCLDHGNNCDHPCVEVNCKTLKTVCNNQYLVCCKECESCSKCAQTCHYKDLREKIKVIKDARNIESHETDDLWNDLDENTYHNSSFPGIKGWKPLWDLIHMNLVDVIVFLYSKCSITFNDFTEKIAQLQSFREVTDSNQERIILILQNYDNCHQQKGKYCKNFPTGKSFLLKCHNFSFKIFQFFNLFTIYYDLYYIYYDIL